jgi:hypothetical protein
MEIIILKLTSSKVVIFLLLSFLLRIFSYSLDVILLIMPSLSQIPSSSLFPQSVRNQGDFVCQVGQRQAFKHEN